LYCDRTAPQARMEMRLRSGLTCGQSAVRWVAPAGDVGKGVSDGCKTDSCDGRKSDSRQHGLAAG